MSPAPFGIITATRSGSISCILIAINAIRAMPFKQLRILPALLLTAVMICSGSLLKVQNNTAENVTIRSLKQLREKAIAIAKDFPDSLYNFQPHPDSRSYIKEIWHISSGFGVLTARMKGERPSKELINVPENIKYDRAAIVDRLTGYSNECLSLLEKQFDPASIFTLAHLSQHYGKIVTLYRVNGLVPPNSKD